MSEAVPPRNASFRPYRAASWALYLVWAVGFSSLIVYSVSKGAFGHQPAAEDLNVSDCRATAKQLFDSLEAERVAQVAAERREAHFVEFRRSWEIRHRAASSQCRSHAPLFEALNEVMVAYGVDVGRYSQASAGAVDRFLSTLGR
jgi:hypothetical protein